MKQFVGIAFAALLIAPVAHAADEKANVEKLAQTWMTDYNNKTPRPYRNNTPKTPQCRSHRGTPTVALRSRLASNKTSPMA